MRKRAVKTYKNWRVILEPILTQDEFVREWNAATSPAEFCKKHGYKRGSAQAKASRLRSSGYDVKSYFNPVEAGRKGGKACHSAPRGFAANPELASIAGAKGGSISRRGSKTQ